MAPAERLYMQRAWDFVAATQPPRHGPTPRTASVRSSETVEHGLFGELDETTLNYVTGKKALFKLQSSPKFLPLGDAVTFRCPDFEPEASFVEFPDISVLPSYFLF